MINRQNEFIYRLNSKINNLFDKNHCFFHFVDSVAKIGREDSPENGNFAIKSLNFEMKFHIFYL